MTDLARELGKLGAWVRLHYVYPYPHVDQVIPLMAEGLVLPYLDIPFQHASPKVLQAMRRPANEAKVLERIRGWRAICPDIAIRSTFVVGFPGETEEDFHYLLDWLEEAQLDRVGAFRFEPVEGAAGQRAARSRARRGQGRALRPHHGDDRRASRAEKLAAKVGRTLDVIIDAVDDETAAPPAAPRPTRPRSTARSICATPAGSRRATSFRCRSRMPTSTTCSAFPLKHFVTRAHG